MKKLVCILPLLLLLAACGSDVQPSASDAAVKSAQQNKVYIPVNHVEQNNYNERQKLADSPSTILWCTSAFSTPGAPMTTVPIVGKLTSGGKRPIPTTKTLVGYTSEYSPETPGPDGMYGQSGEYRYGFGPDGTYYEFYGIETQCSSAPTVWQKEHTTIVNAVDPGLFTAQQEAQKILRDGCGDDATGAKMDTPACKDAEKKAQQLLAAAIGKVGR